MESSLKEEKFYYRTDGEIQTKPTSAIIPISLKATEKSYYKALEICRKIINKISGDIINFKTYAISITYANYIDHHKKNKIISVSFLSGNKDEMFSSNLQFFVKLNLNATDDFWIRTEMISKILDYLSIDFIKEYKNNENIEVKIGQIQYIIEDVESYRGKIISSIYDKAKSMAVVIAEKENQKY